MNNSPAPEHFGHPAGLVTLFFTELWERFSYYGMRALLVLYMVAPESAGGLGWDIRRAGTVYGIYTMAVYLSSIPGGFIADHWMGARSAIFWGGAVIACGHFSLAFHSTGFFFLGLALIVAGTGMLKPNISSLLGQLYPDGDDRRDAGFSIFYMGINLGAAIAPFVCGYLAQDAGFRAWLVRRGFAANSGWHWGFAAAGVGMVIGLVHFIAQKRLLGAAGARLDASKKRAEKKAKATGEVGFSGDEQKRFGAIGILFLFNIAFWAIFEQGGSSLSLFADRLTRNEIFGWSFPSSWFQSVQPIFVITLAPVISWLWLRLGHRQPSSPVKFALGLVFLGLGIGLAVPATLLAIGGRVSPLWLVGVYFLQTIGELCLSPVGLSTVTKLAPPRFVGATMGIWFVSISLGNYLAGTLASHFDDKNLHALVGLFGGMAVSCAIATVLLLGVTPMVKRLMGGVR